MNEDHKQIMEAPISEEALKLAKAISHAVWDKYPDEGGYRSEKQAQNESVSTTNPENIWFFWNQFDSNNQAEFTMLVNNAYKNDQPGSVELYDFCNIELSRLLNFLKEDHGDWGEE